MENERIQKIPELITACVGINIVLVLGYGFAGSYLVRKFFFGQPVYDVYYIAVVGLINISCLSGIVSVIMIEKRSRFSFAACLLFAVSSVATSGAAVTVGAVSSGIRALPVRSMVFLLILVAASVLTVAVVFRPAHFVWARSQGRFFKTVLNPIMFIVFIVLCVLPVCAAVAVNRIGVQSEVASENLAFSASSQHPGYSADNLYANDSGKYWLSASRRNENEWIRVECRNGMEAIDYIDISSPEKEISLMHCRPKSVLIELSDGTVFSAHLEDREDEQTVRIAHKKIKWLKIVFLSLYHGKDKSICVSHIRVFSFRKNILNLDHRKASSVL